MVQMQIIPQHTQATLLAMLLEYSTQNFSEFLYQKPILHGSYLFSSNSADWLTLEDGVDKLGNE